MSKIPGSFRAVLCSVLLIAPVWLPATQARAEDSPSGSEPRVGGSTVYEGWYVVRPGDTLEGLSERYLGDAQRWRDNWRLNPELKNPHALQPGQRLRILLRFLPDEGALLSRMSNRVEDQLPPLAWQEARLADVLRPRDSVRTFEASSAELTFGDETRLTISEESLVFLDRSTATPALPVARDQIEIVLGQADLGGRGRGTGGEAIELIIGEAVAVPEPSSAGQVQARARKAQAGAQLMAYEGDSKLAAAGVEIDVPQGMGSAVPVGAPPGPPEALLPAPGLVAPEDGARLMTPRPGIAWDGVDGASGYVVEVCRDADCAELVARAEARVAGTSAAGASDAIHWRPEAKLPVADLFWRVTAVSPSGLDGYPAKTRAVTVASDSEDTTPPAPDFTASGTFVPPRTGLNAGWILGLGAGLQAAAEDQESGVERIELRLDGQPVSEDAWRGPWQPGEHVAGLTAIDGAGNRTDLPPVPFIYDTVPPGLSWGVEGIGRLASIDTEAAAHPALPTHRARRTLVVDDPHSFWPWRKQEWTVRQDGHQVTLTPSRPVLVSVGAESADDLTVLLAPGRGLWVLAEDAACGPDLRLDHDLEIGAERQGALRKRGVLTLRLGAADCVANRAGATLRMTTTKADRQARAQLDAGSGDGS